MLSDAQKAQAAAWFAKAIFDAKFDAGSDSPQMIMSQRIARTLALSEMGRLADNGTLLECMDKFTKSLIACLSGTYEFQGKQVAPPFSIRCDYHPDALFRHLLEEAGFTDSVAPWKTVFAATDHDIAACHGYTDSMHKIA